MALSLLESLKSPPPLSADLLAIIRRGEDLAQDFLDHATSQPAGGFLHCDAEAVASTLIALRAQRTGPLRFCEWGSGVGTVTLLASRIGFEAHGIELQDELVEISTSFAGTTAATARFACGTFVATEVERGALNSEGPSFLEHVAADGHRALGRSPRDWDVVYCYAWPDEESTLDQVFDACAAPGALLVTVRGENEDVLVFRRDFD